MLFFLIHSTYIIEVMVNTCAHTGVRTSVAVQAFISCLLIHTYSTYTYTVLYQLFIKHS